MSNAEAGGYARRRFWELCDGTFGTGQMLALGYDEIRHRAAALPVGGAAAPARDADAGGLELLHGACEAGSATQALAAYGRLGWPAEEDRGQLALVTGTAVDALEVPRTAGMLAAAWWLLTGGTADEVRGLPALPRPGHALTVVTAADSWFFLARADGPGHLWAGDDTLASVAVPVPSSDGAAVRWHCRGSRIPAPPSPATAWAHLPAGRLRLAPAISLLDLLAKATAAAGHDGQLTFPGGVLVVPVTAPAR